MGKSSAAIRFAWSCATLMLVVGFAIMLMGIKIKRIPVAKAASEQSQTYEAMTRFVRANTNDGVAEVETTVTNSGTTNITLKCLWLDDKMEVVEETASDILIPPNDTRKIVFRIIDSDNAIEHISVVRQIQLP